MRDLHRRVRLLEERAGKFPSGAFHCLQWWPGKSWADVLARHGDPDSIRRGDRVALLKFAAAGHDADPIMQRDAGLASAWLAERGVADA